MQISNKRNERGIVATDAMDKKDNKVILGTTLCQQIRWLIWNWPILSKAQAIKTQGEIDSLNSPISIKDVKSIIRNLPSKKVPCLDSFTGEF